MWFDSVDKALTLAHAETGARRHSLRWSTSAFAGNLFLSLAAYGSPLSLGFRLLLAVGQLRGSWDLLTVVVNGI